VNTALRCGPLLYLRCRRRSVLRRRVERVPQSTPEALFHAGFINDIGRLSWPLRGSLHGPTAYGYFEVGNSRILSPFSPSRFRRASSKRFFDSGSFASWSSMKAPNAARTTSVAEPPKWAARKSARSLSHGSPRLNRAPVDRLAMPMIVHRCTLRTIDLTWAPIWPQSVCAQKKSGHLSTPASLASHDRFRWHHDRGTRRCATLASLWGV
jgi:hypothetical protein